MIKIKRMGLAALTALTLAATATPAEAAGISVSYCSASLQGNTGQAGDNDIRARWDYLQRQGYNIVSSDFNPWGWGSLPNLTWNNNYRFWRANGSVIYTNFRCYWGSDGLYHDGAY